MERRLLEEEFSLFPPEQANAMESHPFGGNDTW